VKFKWTNVLTAAAVFGLLSSGATLAQEPFYKDKTINLLIGYGAGGGNDLRGRLVARYLEKHIPGNPSVVVQNMPGASGTVQVNYMFDTAEPDGLTIGDVNREAAVAEVADRPGVRYTFADFEWLGGLTLEPMIVFIRSELPYETLDDLKQASEPLNFGARQAGATNFLAGKAVEALGVPVKMVLGYSGSQLSLAFEQGEIDASALTFSSFGNRPDWITEEGDGLARLMLALGVNKAKREMPFGPELEVAPENKDLYNLLNLALGLPNATFAAPPGTPEDRVVILREAFQAMIDDPEFREEAAKMGVSLEPIPPEEVDRIFTEFVNSPDEIKAKFVELLN
jgi:tripartite-type tricarboxylate transporter receptor subunit TctC